MNEETVKETIEIITDEENISTIQKFINIVASLVQTCTKK